VRSRKRLKRQPRVGARWWPLLHHNGMKIAPGKLAPARPNQGGHQSRSCMYSPSRSQAAPSSPLRKWPRIGRAFQSTLGTAGEDHLALQKEKQETRALPAIRRQPRLVCPRRKKMLFQTYWPTRPPCGKWWKEAQWKFIHICDRSIFPQHRVSMKRSEGAGDAGPLPDEMA